MDFLHQTVACLEMDKVGECFTMHSLFPWFFRYYSIVDNVVISDILWPLCMGTCETLDAPFRGHSQVLECDLFITPTLIYPHKLLWLVVLHFSKESASKLNWMLSLYQLNLFSSEAISSDDSIHTATWTANSIYFWQISPRYWDGFSMRRPRMNSSLLLSIFLISSLSGSCFGETSPVSSKSLSTLCTVPIDSC